MGLNKFAERTGASDPLAELQQALIEALETGNSGTLETSLNSILLKAQSSGQETASFVRKIVDRALLNPGDTGELSSLILAGSGRISREKAGTVTAQDYFVKTSAKLSFSEVEANATYAAMERYVSQEGVSLAGEELQFLRPYLTSVLAVEDRKNYEENSGYLSETYGSYIKAKNDCYTYANVKIHERFENAYEGSSQDLSGTRFNSTSSSGLSFQRLGPGFTQLSKISTLHLQVGDAVGVNISPNGTGSNHWGVVAVVNGEPKIIGRGGKIEIWSIEDFFQYASGVDVIRYGASVYGQHIEVDASTMLAKVVNRPAPQDFVE